RSPVLLVVGTIPLATGVVCGLLAVSLLFDSRIHGLTLAFGFTLLGVAIDYPVHLLTHSARHAVLDARDIRAPLLLGAASTIIAYLAVSASASPGLAQMGAFSAAGLAGAAAATLLLPLLGTRGPTYLPQRQRRFPNAAWLPVTAGGLALIVLAGLGAERW
ncbi:MAG: xanthomonadin transporter, partial [Wenzhouxiangellaceae bacterium]